MSNGLFTVTLDFGAGVFTGEARWLGIAVKTNGAAAFTALVPRQPLTSAPYALYAPSAGAAATATTAATASQAAVACGVAPNAVTSAGIASGQVVKSLNGLKDAVTLAAGANATLTSNANTLTLATPNDWHLGGNAGTTPGTQFLGTTDNQALQLRANNQVGMHLAPGGNVGIGTNAPTAKLDVAGTVKAAAFQGDGSGLTGISGGGGVADNSITAAKLASDYLSLTKVSGGVMANVAGNIGITIPGSGNTIQALNVDVASFLTETNANASHFLRLRDVGAGGQVALIVKGNGSVGIGTPNPAAKLEVQGGPIKATGGLIIETRSSDPPSPVPGQIWLITP